MPIDLKSFDEGKEVEVGERSNRKVQVMQFLSDNKRKAFTQKEIAEKLSINPTHARGILMSMVEEGTATRKLVTVDGKNRIFYALKA